MENNRQISPDVKEFTTNNDIGMCLEKFKGMNFPDESFRESYRKDINKKILQYIMKYGFSYIKETVTSHPLLWYGTIPIDEYEDTDYYVTIYAPGAWTDNRILINEMDGGNHMPYMCTHRNTAETILKDIFFYHGINDIRFVIGEEVYFLTGMIEAYQEISGIDFWNEPLFDPELAVLFTYYVQQGGGQVPMSDRNPWDPETVKLRLLWQRIVEYSYDKTFYIPLMNPGDHMVTKNELGEYHLEDLSGFRKALNESFGASSKNEIKVLPLYTDIREFRKNFKEGSVPVPLLVIWDQLFTCDKYIPIVLNPDRNQSYVTAFSEDDLLHIRNNLIASSHSMLEKNDVLTHTEKLRNKSETLSYSFHCENSLVRFLDKAVGEDAFSPSEENLHELKRLSDVGSNTWTATGTLFGVPTLLSVNKDELKIRYFPGTGMDQEEVESFLYKTFF